jgi:hypothetical protein
MLEVSQIENIIKGGSNRYAKDLAYHDQLRFQITGVSDTAQVETIRGFEGKHIKTIREKYSTPINWLWSWILTPVDKIFSANGGGVIISDKLDTNIQTIYDKANLLPTGYSVRDWMRKVWLKSFIIDPAGIVLMEHNGNDCFPVVYSIKDIQAYSLNGRYVNWVIFKPYSVTIGNKKISYVRVVDDKTDTTYELNNGKIKGLDKINVNGVERNATIPHPARWKSCPAMLLGDIPDPNKQKVSLSIIDEQLQLGKEYYQLDTIRVFVAIKNGYGTYYWYTRLCKKCNGQGWINDESNSCPDCGGSGRIFPRNINDVYLVDVDETNDNMPDVPGGVIEGDTSGWTAYRDQLKEKESHLELSHWGTHRTEAGRNNTATGAFVDVQVAIDKLNAYADSAERMEHFIYSHISSYYSATVESVSVSYGRRYQVESATAIWDKYKESKTSGVSQASLNNMLIDYYATEYRNDPITRERMIKLIGVEPMPHLSVSEVMELNVPEELKNMKIAFSAWEMEQLDKDILGSNYNELRNSLKDYAAKYIVKPKQLPNE